MSLDTALRRMLAEPIIGACIQAHRSEIPEVVLQFGHKRAHQMEAVQFYDVDNGKVVTIPASELAPGAVRAQVHGIDGIVWLLPEKLKQGSVKHPPFEEGIRDYIR